MDYAAEIYTLASTGKPAVRVIVDGDAAHPWEFALRHNPRTPLQRRACELRAIEYVRPRTAQKVAA
jgi:hypothetical protein